MALPDTAAHARDIGNNTVDAAEVSTKIVADFVKKIFDVLRKGKSLKDPEKPQQIEIKIGRDVVYRGVEGQKPEIDKLSSNQAKLLEKAFDTSPRAIGDPSLAAEDTKGSITLKVNGEPFYQRSRGAVLTNRFVPPENQAASQSIKQEPPSSQGASSPSPGIPVAAVDTSTERAPGSTASPLQQPQSAALPKPVPPQPRIEAPSASAEAEKVATATEVEVNSRPAEAGASRADSDKTKAPELVTPTAIDAGADRPVDQVVEAARAETSGASRVEAPEVTNPARAAEEAPEVNFGQTRTLTEPRVVVAVEPEKMEPGSAQQDAYLIRGVAKSDIGDTREAIADYTRAIERPHEPAFTIQAYIQRAEAESKLGNHQAAVKDLTAAVRLNPSHEYAYRLRAEAHTAAGNLPAAARDLGKQQQVNDGMGNFLVALGSERQGDLHGARDHLDKSIRLDPLNPSVYEVRGRVNLALGDRDAAVRDFNKAQQLDKARISVPIFTIVKNQIADSVKDGTFKTWITAAAGRVSTALAAAGTALETGLQKLNNGASAEREVKQDFQGERDAQYVERTARRLLDVYRGSGTERTFEMRKSGYIVSQSGEALSVKDSGGREVLSSSPGRLVANLTDQDKRAFKASERQLDRDSSSQQRAASL